MPVEMPTIDAIKKFVAMGNGVALLPAITVEQEVAHKELVRVQVPELTFDRKLRLIHRREGTLSHAAEAMLAVVEAQSELDAADSRSRRRSKRLAPSFLSAIVPRRGRHGNTGVTVLHTHTFGGHDCRRIPSNRRKSGRLQARRTDRESLRSRSQPYAVARANALPRSLRNGELIPAVAIDWGFFGWTCHGNATPNAPKLIGAEERTRTSTRLPGLAPEASASANSATPARRGSLQRQQEQYTLPRWSACVIHP